MVLKYGIQLLIDNVGLSFEWIVILIGTLGSSVFMAKDFKLGIIVLLTSMAGVFVWFYERGFNYSLPLIIFLMSLVILVLSLFAVQSTSTTGGFN